MRTGTPLLYTFVMRFKVSSGFCIESVAGRCIFEGRLAMFVMSESGLQFFCSYHLIFVRILHFCLSRFRAVIYNFGQRYSIAWRLLTYGFFFTFIFGMYFRFYWIFVKRRGLRQRTCELTIMYFEYSGFYPVYFAFGFRFLLSPFILIMSPGPPLHLMF